MKKMFLIVLIGIIFLPVILQVSCGSQSSARTEDMLANLDDYPEFTGSEYNLYYFEETAEAFPNPIKGFRPGVGAELLNFPRHEYARVYKHYIRYSDLENSKDYTVQSIINWSNMAWEGIEERNIKVIPRVVLTSPISNQAGTPYLEYWPVDIPQPDLVSRWTTKELMDRFTIFVQKLGEAWDNDPRVAAVEIGLWGHWGEHHLYPLRNDMNIPVSAQEVLGDAFQSAFKNKKVMVRQPDAFTSYQFGYFYDAFGIPAQGGTGIIRRNVWRNQMISGEIAYDLPEGHQQLGSTPDETLRNDNYTDYLISWIKRINASSLGWVDEYNQNDQTLKTNAANVQKALGYRFVVRSAIFNKRKNSGENFEIGLKISNVGSAPFYYKWPVEISLLNQDRELVYSKILTDIDITKWLPNETNTIYCRIDTSENIPNGTYIVAVSIVDPAGNKPSIRFANTNYYKGGRTPLGVIGINQEPDFTDLGSFDSLYNDNSLGYEVPQAPRQLLDTGFTIYDDFLNRKYFVYHWGENADFSLNDTNRTQGQYAIRWENADQNNHFEFVSAPEDFTRLVSEGYCLEFKARTTDSVNFAVLFMNPESPSSNPWQMSYTVNLPSGGAWQTIRIPLRNMQERGAWVQATEQWLNPRGEFSWANVRTLRFVAEQQDMKGITVWFDDIKITR